MTSSARREAVGGELRAGIRIGDRYRLERRIAEGGMSVVWEATHLTLDRTVAVKFLDVFGRRAEEARERFLREARLVAAIRNRHVVDVIDFGTEPGGRPYMVMERLEGMTLAQRMERDPALSVGEVIEIIASVLTGLSAVHEAGIVHRDLKPENVFLVEDADGVSPKILDFGVSRAIEGELESVMPTLENAIVGTPQFMSPEQARGLRDIDHRTDLWSTGVMLFELLTGVLPFDAEVVGDILVRIATQEAPDLESLRPDLGEPFASVVRKALCRDRDRRWASAREMRGALLVAASETELRLDHVLSSGEGPVLDAERLDQSVVRARADMPTQEATDQALAPAPTAPAPASSPPPPRTRAQGIALALALALALAVGLALAVYAWPRATVVSAPAPTATPAGAPTRAIVAPAPVDPGEAAPAGEPSETQEDFTPETAPEIAPEIAPAPAPVPSAEPLDPVSAPAPPARAPEARPPARPRRAPGLLRDPGF